MANKSLLFSVLIANYNNENFLSETLDSIKQQSYPNIEIIIVDDASTDNSVARIRQHQKLDERIVLAINSENKGCGYTKRRCVEAANGDICGFVDPEDTISNDAIDLMVKIHEINPSVSLVFSNSFFCNDQLKVLRLRKLKIPEGVINTTQLNDQKISHFATFKKSSYIKTCGINPILKRAIDQDLYLKLEEQGKVFYLNKDLYYYRYHDKGISAFDNRYKAKYWFYYVKYETCIRREIEPEEFFAEEYKETINYYRNRIDFKLGNLILKLPRYLISKYRIFLSKIAIKKRGIKK